MKTKKKIVNDFFFQIKYFKVKLRSILLFKHQLKYKLKKKFYLDISNNNNINIKYIMVYINTYERHQKNCIQQKKLTIKSYKHYNMVILRYENN